MYIHDHNYTIRAIPVLMSLNGTTGMVLALKSNQGPNRLLGTINFIALMFDSSAGLVQKYNISHPLILASAQ